MEKSCDFFYIAQLYYVVAIFELAGCLVEKVGQGQRLCNCVNNQFFRAIHMQGEGEEGDLSIFVIDLNSIYVVGKPELGTYANWLVIVNFKCISIVQVVPLM